MTIQLPADVLAIIRAKLASGEFATESDVLAAGVRLLQSGEDEQALQENKLRNMLQVAVDEIERGEYRDGEEVFAEVLRELGDDGELLC